MNFKILRHIARNYFTLTRGQRNGLIFLCSLLIVVIIINYSIDFIEINTVSDFDKIEEAIAIWEAQQTNTINTNNRELFSFNPNTITKESLDSLDIPSNIKSNLLKYRQSGGVYYNRESIRKIYGMNDSIFDVIAPYLNFNNKTIRKESTEIKDDCKKTVKLSYFDPNLVSKTTLEEMGFSEFLASNLIKFRESGGFFKYPEDLLKIYGIDSVLYENIKPWIKMNDLQPSSHSEIPPVIIELNTADSVSLVSLPGIGPVFASRIIKYRNLLGGFYSSGQLLEVYNFKKETLEMIEEQIKIDTTLIIKISLNFSGVNNLKKHPYINESLAKNIIEVRNNNGPFETCSEILSKKTLSYDDYIKIKPYLKVN